MRIIYLETLCAICGKDILIGEMVRVPQGYVCACKECVDCMANSYKKCGCEGFYALFGVHRPGCSKALIEREVK